MPEADHVDALVALLLDPALELGEHVGRNRLEPLGRGREAPFQAAIEPED